MAPDMARGLIGVILAQEGRLVMEAIKGRSAVLRSRAFGVDRSGW